MDAKITKSRLAHFLSYDFGKIIAVMVAVVIFWLLIFQVSATRITAAQQYNVYNYVGTAVGTKFDGYKQFANKDVFSYEVMETHVYDLSLQGSELGLVMQSRTSVNEIDAMFVADAPDEDGLKYKDENGTEYSATYLEGMLFTYYTAILPFDGKNGLLETVEKYLNEYFTNGYQDLTSLDEVKLEQDFRERIKKDKRFKKEEQKAAALLEEIARLKSYAVALTQFNEYLADGVVALQEKTVYLTDNKDEIEYVLTGKYSLNLCPDESKTNFKDVAFYFEKDGEGNYTQKTSKDVNLVLFRMPHEFDIFLGEHLLFINKIIAENLV